MFVVAVPPAATSTAAGALAAATGPRPPPDPSGCRTVRSTARAGVAAWFSSVTLARTVAARAVTSGVVMKVPSGATARGAVWSSQTLRKIPPPGYQRDEAGGLSSRSASTFSPARKKGVRSSRKDA
jgi:hypothetical protein